MAASSPRVFISYSHDSPEHDGRVLALADRLVRDGLDCVIDRYQPNPPEPWPRWMERQIEDADFVLVVCTETYLRRAAGREASGEGRGAAFETVLITQDLYDAAMWNAKFVPVVLDRESADHVPKPLRGYTRYCLDDETAYEDLYRHLTRQPRVTKPARGAVRELAGKPAWPSGSSSGVRFPPKLPPHYLERAVYLERLERALFAAGGRRLGISGAGAVGVQGMGGIGKTVLAAAVARSPAIAAAFTDGVLWMTVGQDPDLLALLRELAAACGAPEAVFASPFHAKQQVLKLLADRRVLLVLDDLWTFTDVEALDVVGPEGRLLLTSRNRELLVRLGAAEVQVDVLGAGEALALLAEWAGEDPEALPPVARRVADECGRLPLALAMIGATVRLRPGAWEDALERLERADLGRIRGQFPDYPYLDLLRALEVSVEALEPWQRARYLELAVFPEDAAVPEAALATLWSAAGLADDEARDLIGVLVARSLTARDAAGHLTLHDLQRDYLRRRAGDLRALHRTLVGAYAARSPDGLAGAPDDGYLFQRLVGHLVAGSMDEELGALLFDLRWLEGKLSSTDVNALMADYEHLADRPAARHLQAALRLAAHVLVSDPGQLAGQLQGRLTAHDLPEIAALRAQAAGPRPVASLRPRWPSLNAPGGALVRILEGHLGGVWAVARLDARRIVSGGGDETLRVWDVETGDTLAILEGHDGAVSGLAALDERRVVSAHYDGTLRVWDVESGAMLRTLRGHPDGASAVARLDGRRVISASDDGTLRVWDVESGIALAVLAGHTAGVVAVARLDERRVVSGSLDGTLRVWDLERSATLLTLEGHPGALARPAWRAWGGEGIWAVARLDARRVVAGSSDGHIRVWDVESGTALARLEGHTGTIQALAPLDERRLISASYDSTLRIWDLESGATLARLEGHTASVFAVVPLDARRVVSASNDETLRVWDVEAGASLLDPDGLTGEASAVAVGEREGHLGGVDVVAPLDARRVVCASTGRTLRLRDLASGSMLATLEGHTDLVTAAVWVDERRVVSASRDRTLRLWDAASGTALAVLAGHTGVVTALAQLDARRVVSGSDDRTLRVWDVDTGSQLGILAGHEGGIRAVASLGAGRVVSASEDRTLRVWDVESGAKLATLVGHTDIVFGLAPLDGRRVVSISRDDDLRIWDAQSGVTLDLLKGYASWIEALTRLDDRRLVFASSDCSLMVWDADARVTVAVFTLDAPPTAVGMVAGSTLVVAGDASGKVHCLAFEEPA